MAPVYLGLRLAGPGHAVPSSHQRYVHFAVHANTRRCTCDPTLPRHAWHPPGLCRECHTMIAALRALACLRWTHAGHHYIGHAYICDDYTGHNYTGP